MFTGTWLHESIITLIFTHVGLISTADLQNTSCESYLLPICHIILITQITLTRSSKKASPKTQSNWIIAHVSSPRSSWHILKGHNWELIQKKDKFFILTDISVEVKRCVRGYQRESEVKLWVSSVPFPYRVILFQVLCRILLCISSDFSNKDNALRLGILQEHLQTVYEVCTIKWIPANTLEETKQTLDNDNSCEWRSHGGSDLIKQGAGGRQLHVDTIW